MLAYDVSPNSPWGIDKKLMAMVLGLLMGLPGVAMADMTFTFTTIDVPLSSGTSVDANSPNAIAGEYYDVSGDTHGFILRGGASKAFKQEDVGGGERFHASVSPGDNRQGFQGGSAAAEGGGPHTEGFWNISEQFKRFYRRFIAPAAGVRHSTP
jgi:hypothetical protein